MNNIKILDCTLRDGGYVNNWSFSDDRIKNIIGALEDSNVDIIEMGYLDDKRGAKKNSTLFSSLSTINSKFENKNTSHLSLKVIMINFGDYDIKKLDQKDNNFIDGIRLAFHKNDLESALLEATDIIKLGYKLFFQPMVTKSYTDLEFLSMLEEVNKINPYAFYIVDSFGSITLDEFSKYIMLSNGNLNSSISIGYHSHNNMQLAFSNTIKMFNTIKNRNIIADSSVYGIGRGAGNLNTELIIDYFNNNYHKKYKILPLLELIDEYLYSLMRKTPWGFSPAQYLSASFDCHPNYSSYLVNKNTNHMVTIKNILEKIPHKNKAVFNKKLVKELYIDFSLTTKTKVRGGMNIRENQEVLLIASGKSTDDYKVLIDKIINNKNIVIIALNHNPQFNCDYYFFSNQKRFDSFDGCIPIEKIAITSNIKTTKNIDIVLNIKKIAFLDGVFVSNVAIIAINYLIEKGVKHVNIAGLDGYNKEADNYNYNETDIVFDNKSLEKENTNIRNCLKLLYGKISINFITPSIFEIEKKLNILGVIPARFKSSRFEGKPLCLINGIPMIKRTYIQAVKSKKLTKLVVATDSTIIKEYCDKENIPVIMTSENCLTGTDRVSQVSNILEPYDFYVNIQGDEPVIDPISIDQIVEEFIQHREKYLVYNLFKIITINDEVHTDTIIKAIISENNELIYMSRLGVPFNKSENTPIFKKQVCVYGYSKEALNVFSNRKKTINEKFEDIELLRFLDMGYKVKMVETNCESIAVDIPDDIKKVEVFLNNKINK